MHKTITRKKSVLLVSAFDPKLNPYIILFRNALIEQGLDVDIIRHFGLSLLLKNRKSIDFIHLHWIDLSSGYAKRAFGSKLHRLIANRYVNTFFEALRLLDLLSAFIFARLAGIKIFLTVHDLFHFGKQSLRKTIFKFIGYRTVFLFAHSIHAHNHHTLKLIEAKYHRKKGIHVIPHGNYVGCYPNHISKSQARSLLRIPEPNFVFLFLGLLRPYKGLEDLIDSFKKFDYPNANLLIAGKVFLEEGYETALRRRIESDDRIHLVPEFIPDEQLQNYMNACDIYVLPYKDITTSGAAALALSFYRPIIAPAISSFPEVITPESGVLYDPNTPNSLLKAMKTSCLRKWDESKIRAHTESFDWTVLGARLSGFYM